MLILFSSKNLKAFCIVLSFVVSFFILVILFPFNSFISLLKFSKFSHFQQPFFVL